MNYMSVCVFKIWAFDFINQSTFGHIVDYVVSKPRLSIALKNICISYFFFFRYQRMFKQSMCEWWNVCGSCEQVSMQLYCIHHRNKMRDNRFVHFPLNTWVKFNSWNSILEMYGKKMNDWQQIIRPRLSVAPQLSAPVLHVIKLKPQRLTCGKKEVRWDRWSFSGFISKDNKYSKFHAYRE